MTLGRRNLAFERAGIGVRNVAVFYPYWHLIDRVYFFCWDHLCCARVGG